MECDYGIQFAFKQRAKNEIFWRLLPGLVMEASGAIGFGFFSVRGRRRVRNKIPRFSQSGTCPPFPHLVVGTLIKFWSLID